LHGDGSNQTSQLSRNCRQLINVAVVETKSKLDANR
jgi:hypothetical protein